VAGLAYPYPGRIAAKSSNAIWIALRQAGKEQIIFSNPAYPKGSRVFYFPEMN
jgi:hypothetical protein